MGACYWCVSNFQLFSEIGFGTGLQRSASESRTCTDCPQVLRCRQMERHHSSARVIFSWFQELFLVSACSAPHPSRGRAQIVRKFCVVGRRRGTIRLQGLSHSGRWKATVTNWNMQRYPGNRLKSMKLTEIASIFYNEGWLWTLRSSWKFQHLP